ncbi:MAG: ATP synthase F1 subunit epsilon [Actinomycetota bacterium]
MVSPERDVYEGEAEMVVAKGTDGDVGILPGHAPMLVELAIHPVRMIDGQSEQVVLVDGGFLHVTSSQEETRVDVLAESAELASEADPAAARRRAEELRERAEAGEARAQMEVAKALMRAEHGG